MNTVLVLGILVAIVIGYVFLLAFVTRRFKNRPVAMTLVSAMGVGAIFGLAAFALVMVDPKYEPLGIEVKLQTAGVISVLAFLALILSITIPLYLRTRNRDSGTRK